jgi:uncharacterized phage protein gp47/JayE
MANDQWFTTFRRGEIRDTVLLSFFRNALRLTVNPSTGILFTEDEIATATAAGSRYYIEADTHDIGTQAAQARALWLADQLWPGHASTKMLDQFHGALWFGPDSRLPAVGASGTVLATATVGSIYVGSATLGDPAATVATDPNGIHFQVLVTTIMPAGGTCSIPVQAVEGGTATNLPTGTVLRWSANVPPASTPECTVEAPGMADGFGLETDAEYSARIEERIRRQPACGNAAHFDVWGRDSSGAVEKCFIYPCALNAGSVMVVPLEKRGTSVGPGVRVQVSDATMASVITMLTPPNSPVVPQHVFSRVQRANSQSSDLVVGVAMDFGSVVGWYDADPWPRPTANYPAPAVSGGIGPLTFTIQTDDPLVAGVLPEMMIWNPAASAWERLHVATVIGPAPNWVITLQTGSAVSFTVQVGDRVSPHTAQAELISDTLTAYFDELGPGEVVDLATDARGGRAFRHPTPAEGYPSQANTTAVTRLLDALGAIASNVSLIAISRMDPDLPGSVSDGPNQVTLGRVTLAPL